MSTVKQRILKAAKKKQLVMIEGTTIRPSPDFTRETSETKREWHYLFKMMKGKQPRTLYTARLLLKTEGETKSIPKK